MIDIFISYASEDRFRVRLLADALSNHGWSVWWDSRIPAGKTFDQVIAEALDAARCVVVVWSRHSVASSWVREEADVGRKRGVLIPVLIDEVSPPLGFGRIQAASMIEWDGAQESDAFQKLAADIAAIINTAPARTPALETIAPKAPEHAPFARTFVHGRSLQLLFATALVVALLAIVAYRTFSRGGDASERRLPRPTPETSALLLTTVLTDGGEPLTRGVAYVVYTAEEDAHGNRKRVTESSQYEAAARFALPAGRYFVTAAYGNASANLEVEVTPAVVTRQIVNLRAGFLRLTTVPANGGDALSGVAYEVYTAARDVEGIRKRVTGSNHQSETSARFLLPAGRYFVTGAHSGGNASAETVVTAGGAQDVQLRIAPVTKR